MVVPDSGSVKRPAPATQAGRAFEVSWVTDFDTLRAGADVNDAQSVDLFHTIPWFENLARHGIAPGEGLHIGVVRSAHADEAFAVPLQVRRRESVSVIGRSLAGLSNYYGSLFGPAGSEAACTEAACRELVRSMRKNLPGSAVVDLHPLDADGAFCRHMRSALTTEGYWVASYFCFGNWHLPVAGRSYAEYERGISSRQRNTIRRARKKLDEAGDWALRIHQDPGEDLERAIADYEAIYRRSWKQPEPFPQFVPELCRWTARRGWLRLGVVRVGATPVAAQIWFVHRDKALIFKLAYDEAFKRLSAGSVLTADLMRHVIDVDKVVDVDYLTGDDAYKADWMSTRRERVGLVAFHRRSLAGWLGAARHFGGAQLTRWTRKSAPAGEGAPATTDPNRGRIEV